MERRSEKGGSWRASGREIRAKRLAERRDARSHTLAEARVYVAVCLYFGIYRVTRWECLLRDTRRYSRENNIRMHLRCKFR